MPNYDAMLPAEAITAKFADPEFMKVYRNKLASGHKESVREMEILFQKKVAAGSQR